LKIEANSHILIKIFKEGYNVKTLMALTLLFAQAHATPSCEDTAGAFLNYQHEILSSVENKKESDAEWLKKISHPLRCLLRGREMTTGLDQYLAGAFLEPLMGGEIPNKLPDDVRYRKVAEIFHRLSLNSPNILNDSVVADFAQAEWGIYEGWGQGFSVFMPNENSIQSRPPLMAASSMIHLKKAYLVLQGKERQEVANRIKNLYETTPKDSVLQRKVIDQIYREIFEPQIKLNLSMS
jgi:hypothetical protein